jgi:phosphogluconate dehydratase
MKTPRVSGCTSRCCRSHRTPARTQPRHTRRGYLDRIHAVDRGVRTANAFRAATSRMVLPPAASMTTLRDGHAPNIGIVTAYNDMLSAHQPYERYPELIREIARDAGGTAQVAGGVPAMCDGVTQGQPGHGAVAVLARPDRHGHRHRAVARHVRRRAVSGHLRQDRAGPADRRAQLRPSAGRVRAGGPMPSGISRTNEKSKVRQAYTEGKVAGAELLEAEAGPITRPAPAPSTAPPTPIRC